MAAATAKYRVRPGNHITLGMPPDKDGKVEIKTFNAGQEVELTKEQAVSASHAVEKGGKPKDTRTLAQRRRDAEEELSEIAKLEAAQNRRSRRSDPGRAKALEQIGARPDNAASGIPSYGRIPADFADRIEQAEEDLREGGGDDAEELEHGFGREAGSGGGGGTGREAGAGDTDDENGDEPDEFEGRVEANAQDLIDEAKSLDDEDEIKSLKAAEKKGKNRTTVIAAFDDRLKELREKK